MSTTEQLTEKLNDKDWLARVKAVEDLAETGRQEAVPSLVGRLTDEDWYVRAHATKALGELGDTEVVAPLLNALKDREPVVRSAAANALGELGDKRAVPELARLLGDREEQLFSAVLDALIALDATADLDFPSEIFIIHRLRNHYRQYGRPENTPALIDTIHESLKKTFRSWPALYCTTCYKRPQSAKLKLGLFKRLHYAVCPQCSSSILEQGVQEVVGVISDRTGWEKRDTTLYVQLWDDRAEECAYADIDRLEIWEVPELRYDIAVNHLILKLHDFSGRGAGYLKSIPVRIVDEPDIPVGTMSLLEQEFREVGRR